MSLKSFFCIPNQVRFEDGSLGKLHQFAPPARTACDTKFVQSRFVLANET